MDVPKANPEPENTPEAVATKYCECKKTEEADFMDNAKKYMKSFTSASLDDHKACFKASWNKMIGRFQEAKTAVFKSGSTPSEN